MANRTENKKRIGALDIFIILVVLIVIASIVVRFISNRNSDYGDKVQLDNYVVSFKIMGIKDSSAKNYFEAGTNFYLDEGDAFLGTLREGVTINDALKYYYLHDGSVIGVQNSATGNLYRVDVEGALDVTGKTDQNGKFLLNGNTYIAKNSEVKIYSKYLSVVILVTDITKG